MKIAKLDDLHGRCQQLLLCRVGDGIQVIGRAAALAEPRLHKLVVREVGECARQSRRVGGESASCQFKPTCHGCFVAASLFAIGFGLWAASTSNARVTPATGQGIDPLQLMMNAKDVPAVGFADHTFVFH